MLLLNIRTDSRYKQTSVIICNPVTNGTVSKKHPLKIKSLLFFLLFISCKILFCQWQQLPNFPAAGRDDGSVFIIGTTAYCGTGNAAGIGASTDFYKFNLLTDTWAG